MQPSHQPAPILPRTDGTPPSDRLACQALDAADPLTPLRAHFEIPPGVIYLDGNSLGMLPRATPERLAHVIRSEWGRDLIRSWNTAGWFDRPRALGDRLAGLIGARPGETVVTDTTSVNLYKVLGAALRAARSHDPRRRRILSERSNFPTDLYIAEGLCRDQDAVLELVEADDLHAALARTDDVAILMLTHVHYRTGAMHDMAALTAAAHAHGALMVWDLAHSAGAVPVDLHAADADFAVGCTYKYLNGGPGAPAFVWVHPRQQDTLPPLSGWWGHARPFAFDPEFTPAPGAARWQCGTQPIISLTGVECGLDIFDALEALGGMAALRAKSLSLTDLFMQHIAAPAERHGITVATPRAAHQRGSQVSLALPASGAIDGFAVVQALIARGVIGDFRAGAPASADGRIQALPDILRFGFTPLTLNHDEVWQAAAHLTEVLDTGCWRAPRFLARAQVT